MKLHPEVMSDPQRATLRRLGPFASRRGFYLGGGTAVALHLGHRQSVDLDWFLDDGFGDPLRLASELRGQGLDVALTETAAGTLQAIIGGVQTSFLEYRYPLLEKLVGLEDYGCRLASLEDLACVKLSAITSRGARRDFIDLWAILTTGLSLRRALQLYAQKFQVTDIGHVLRSLSYFDDATSEAMPVILRSMSWDEIRRSFEQWVKESAAWGPAGSD